MAKKAKRKVVPSATENAMERLQRERKFRLLRQVRLEKQIRLLTRQLTGLIDRRSGELLELARFIQNQIEPAADDDRAGARDADRMALAGR